MEVIKRSDKVAFIRKHIGDATITDDEKEELVTLSVSNNYAPIVEFQDGDKVIFSWEDIIEIADKERQKGVHLNE